MLSHLHKRTGLRTRRKLSVYLTITALVFSGLTLALRDAIYAQALVKNPDNLAYDVASIRPFKITGGGFQRTILEPPHVGTFRATAVTVRVLLHFAYGVGENMIDGGPPWMSTDLYDVNAKADDSVNEVLQHMPEKEAVKAKEQMLQNLLSDRFQLKAHLEERSGVIQNLTLTKRGFKIKPDTLAGVVDGTHPSMHIDGESMVFQHITMGDFIHLMKDFNHIEIVDKTGIVGKYSFSLRYQFGRLSSAAQGDDQSAPTLEDALPSQLGLKLTSQKGSVGMLVIDHIEKPSPN